MKTITVLIMLVVVFNLYSQQHQKLDSLLHCNFTPKSFKRLLYTLKFPDPNKAYLHSLSVTGYFESDIVKQCNNMFCYFIDQNFKTIADTFIVFDDRKLGVYRSWQNSVIDYKMFLDDNRCGDDYLLFLNEQGYDEKLIELIKKF